MSTIPIIVGVGEAKNKAIDVNHPIEPAHLMIEAIRRAFDDASISAADQQAVDSISVVPPWTWAYPDLPGYLAETMHVRPAHMLLGRHGGDQPAFLCDEAARRITAGETKLAIITGGEALATLAACHKADKLPPPGWCEQDADAKQIVMNDPLLYGQNTASRHSMGLPIHVYPMYENAFRAHYRQTQQQNQQESAEMYADFDRIACRHPYSWRFGETPRDAQAIGTPSKKNRMICTPYPLLQNAFNLVNLAAACILTSVEHAEKMGISQDKWVYILGGAGADDVEDFWKRSNFYSSPSLEYSLDAAMVAAGITKEEVDCFDFYSCFPIVPKLACKHLGLPTTQSPKPISLLGGLTSFGGAGNNYSMHAIVKMAQSLRARTFRTGLVLANGGVLTHHYSICLSCEPRRSSPTRTVARPQLHPATLPPIDETPDGVAIIEFSRQGHPKLAHIVGRLDNGHRFVANHGDEATLTALVNTDKEAIGRSCEVHEKSGRNLVYIPDASSSKL